VKKTIQVAILTLFGISLFKVGYSFQEGPPPGRSGVPAGGGFAAELTCVEMCHNSFDLNPDTLGQMEIVGLPDNYLPGQRYQLEFRLSYPIPDRSAWGFQATAVEMDTYRGAGTFVVTDPRRTQIRLGGPEGANRQYIEHTPLGSRPTGQLGSSWRFDWVAPETNVGDIGFYASGNAAGFPRGNSVGDRIFNPTPNPLARTKGQFTFSDIAVRANVAAGAGRGVAVGDFNQDGWPDLFVVADGQYRLYRNNGDNTFTDVTASSGITASQAQGQAAAWGDYNGDGNPDLYVVTAGADVLYRNNGDGTFTDVTREAGISDDSLGHAAVWADFNGDGLADIYVANEGQDVLYLNNRDGTFSKANPAVTGMTEDAASWSVAVADYNGDGWLDIFVANEGQDALYRNNGDGTFTDVAVAAGILTTNGQGRAAAWGDFDGDGKVDLFIANVGADLLYKNNGNGSFTEMTAMAGMADTAVGAAAAWADYDNDGDLDLFVANEGQDFLYRNNGNGTFNEVAMHSGMTDAAVGAAAAWLDVNDDGNPDLFVANTVGDNFLYLNPGRSGSAPPMMALSGRIRNLNLKIRNGSDFGFRALDFLAGNLKLGMILLVWFGFRISCFGFACRGIHRVAHMPTRPAALLVRRMIMKDRNKALMPLKRSICCGDGYRICRILFPTRRDDVGNRAKKELQRSGRSQKDEEFSDS
jgi:hypothetical protein